MTESATERQAELQWFQVALKTYFWFGAAFAFVFSISVVCLAATKYYCDQAELRHIEMQRDFRSYEMKMRADYERSRRVHVDIGKAWYAVDQMRKEVEAKIGPIDGGQSPGE